jgi:hypothetical protein
MEPLLEKIFVARDALWQQSGERVAKQDVDDALIHRFVDFRRQKYFFSTNCNLIGLLIIGGVKRIAKVAEVKTKESTRQFLGSSLVGEKRVTGTS